jgi:hypothetical protein
MQSSPFHSVKEPLTITFNSTNHEVDTITHCKKTQGGQSLF